MRETGLADLMRARAGRALALCSGARARNSLPAAGRMAAAPVVIFGEQGFGPEVVEAMDLAFRRTCEQLGLVEVDDPATRLVAEKIIHHVRAGICDPERLCAYVLEELS